MNDFCFGSQRKIKTKTKNSIPSGGIEPPSGGLELPIFGLEDRRLIHWATRAAENLRTFLQMGSQVHTQLNKIESQSQTASNFLHDHVCQDHVKRIIHQDHVCKDHVKTMFVKTMSKDYCQEHVCQDHVCLDHV